VLEELDEMSRAETAYVPPYFRAVAHSDVGELDQAFEWLNKSYDEHDPWLIFLKADRPGKAFVLIHVALPFLRRWAW